MANLKTFKKATTTLVLSALFAVAAFAQNSSAMALSTKSVTLNPLQNYTLVVTDNDSYVDSLDVNRLKNYKKSERDTLISFLQFDVTRPETTSVISAYLSLFGSGTGTVSLYHVDEDWINNVDQSQITNLRYDTSRLVGSAAVSDTEDTYNFNFTELPSPEDELLSLVLLGDQYTNASFYSFIEDDYTTWENGPKLNTEVYEEPTPNPEPSSMLLGIMGLGSMLGFRRKKA